MTDPVTAYIAAAPEGRRERLTMLHACITALYPAARVDLKYRMPTYTMGEGWVAVANQKQYISLYTCNAAHLETFKAQHPDIRTGKGCINFRDRDEIPLGDVEAVVRHAIEHPKGH